MSKCEPAERPPATGVQPNVNAQRIDRLTLLSTATIVLFARIIYEVNYPRSLYFHPPTHPDTIALF
jgi:hypothetical protein